MTLLICMAAIIAAVIIGNLAKVNTGLIAMLFAFVIGNLILGMSIDEIISLVPIDIIFYLFSITLLFNHAVLNGSMEKVGKKLLRLVGGHRLLIPWAIMVICALVGGLGAGASTPVIVGPFAYAIAISSKVDPVVTAIAICFGNLIGSNNPYNGYGGVISKSLILENGICKTGIDDISNRVWFNCSLMCLVIVAVFFTRMLLIDKKSNNIGSTKVSSIDMADTAGFDKTQIKTVLILVISCLFMFIPAIINLLIPSASLSTVFGLLKPQVVLLAAGVICMFLNLAPWDDVIKGIPLNTIIMITGMYMLIEIGANAGLTDYMSNLLQASIPVALVPGALVFFAAFLSFFSSTTSTVMPLMYPLVPALSSSMGLDPAMLYSCIFFGGLSADISPYSTGGALTLAGCPDPGIRESLILSMTICAAVIPLIVILAVQLGLFSIL